MVILLLGQTAWLNATPDDIRTQDPDLDAEWRLALAALATGELQCWRSADDELDESRLRRVNAAAFHRPFGLLFLSPSAIRRWFGDRSLFASSRQTYFFDESQWCLLQQKLLPASPKAQADGPAANPQTPVHTPAVRHDRCTDWSAHPNRGDWAEFLFMPTARFHAVIDQAYPKGFTTAGVCKPRLALMTAHQLLNQHGPGLAIDQLTAEIRTAIWRQGYVDNSLSNSARRGDLAQIDKTACKPADDWIASAVRGKYSAIASTIRNAESQLIASGRLPPLD